MAIQFRCGGCNRLLSIGTRKAGTATTCPKCGATILVPTPEAEPLPATPRERRWPLVAVVIALLVLLAGGIAAVVTLKRQHAREAEQTRVEPSSFETSRTSTAPEIAPAPRERNAKPQAVDPQSPQPELPPAPKFDQPTLPTQQAGPAVAPYPHFALPPLLPPPPTYDRFGNPIGQYGLASPGQFRGKKLLFWSGFEGAGRVFFAATNPLWQALKDQGFLVTVQFGKFNPEWLKEIDQLWILSTGKLDLPGGITPDLLELGLSMLPASAVPSGFTAQEYQFVVKATLDCVLSPCHPLGEGDYRAIVDFVKAGKGLCLLADDEPFTVEANELSRRLFGAGVGGNYIADKVAYVRGHGLKPEDVKKFGGQFEVADHPLLTGVNFLFEGITVSHVADSDKLDPALMASDGQTLIAVSKVQGQRVVIDCGFTRYCHGPEPRVSYIQKTPGTVRLGENIAAYLAGKDKKP
ncbi:MAG TPA: hypothetical protein VLM40_17055 [Gemmata sp.]|nr:hypothetical protein [Gemmata sp.]